MSHSRPKKRKPNKDLIVPEKKQREVKEKEKKTSLNSEQKSMIDAVLELYITSKTYDPLSDLTPTNALRLLDLMLEPDNESTLTVDEIYFFKKNNLFDNLVYMRKLLQHPYPQNRTSGDAGAFVKGSHLKGKDAKTEEEKIAAGEITKLGAYVGVYRGIVYFFTPLGLPGAVLKEPQGLLGLTTKEIKLDKKTAKKHGFFNNPDSIGRQEVIAYVREKMLAAQTIQRQKIKHGEEKSYTPIKVTELTDEIREQLSINLQKKYISLEDINQKKSDEISFIFNRIIETMKNPLFKSLIDQGVTDLAKDIYLQPIEEVNKTFNLINDFSKEKKIDIEKIDNLQWNVFLIMNQLLISKTISLSSINFHKLMSELNKMVTYFQDPTHIMYHLKKNNILTVALCYNLIKIKQGSCVEVLNNFFINKEISIDDIEKWGFSNVTFIIGLYFKNENVKNLVDGGFMRLGDIYRWGVVVAGKVANFARQPLIIDLVKESKLTLSQIHDMSDEQRSNFLTCMSIPSMKESFIGGMHSLQEILTMYPLALQISLMNRKP